MVTISEYEREKRRAEEEEAKIEELKAEIHRLTSDDVPTEPDSQDAPGPDDEA